MQIQLLFFGITTEITKKNEMQFEISNDETVLSLRNKLAELYPKLNDFKQYAVAINMEYAEDSSVIKPNDVVALIPPVSGG